MGGNVNYSSIEVPLQVKIPGNLNRSGSWRLFLRRVPVDVPNILIKTPTVMIKDIYETTQNLCIC